MSFSEVVGQERAIEVLKREFFHGRVSHAYLFTGMESVGKQLTALAFAKVLQCDRADGDSCGVCPPCLKITKGTHPDVRFYVPESRTKGARSKIYIEQIRNLQSDISLKAMEGKKKVFVINDADRMVEQAANALLKTLEEPPQDSYLILVTAFPDLLPRTVLSRCRAVRFQSLSEKSVETILKQKKGLDGDQAELMARYSRGRVDKVLEMEGAEIVSQRDRFLEWMQGCDLQKVGSIFELSERFTKNTNEAIEFVEFFLSWTRDLISMKLRGSKGGLIHADKALDLERECRNMRLSALLKNADILEAALKKLKMNVNQRLVIETGLMQMGNEA
jgi:DNA polymerase-3 subunit delta'